jgi:hypothetical protein
MHIGRPQIMRDGGEARVSGLQPPHLAGRERIRGPIRARHAASEEQRILLVVFGATHPSGRQQHQRRNDQDRQKRMAERVHAASFTVGLGAELYVGSARIRKSLGAMMRKLPDTVSQKMRQFSTLCVDGGTRQYSAS